MNSTIQLKGNTSGAEIAVAGLAPREPIFSNGGFSNVASYTAAGWELAIFDGASTRFLVSPQRQVELIGAQTITGRKTFSLGVGGSLSITGGTPGQVMGTDGAGVLDWIDGGGGAPTYTWGLGLSETAGTVDLNFAGNNIAFLGGVFVQAQALSGLVLNAGTGQLSAPIAGNTAAERGEVFVAPGTGLTLNLATGQLTLTPAQAAVLGGVMVGAPATSGLDLLGTGDLSLTRATPAYIGGVMVGAPATSGLILAAASGDLSLAIATGTQRGGVSVPPAGGLQVDGAGAITTFPAVRAEVTAGIDNAKPITAAMLQMGDDPLNLATGNKTLVGAINEIMQRLGAVSGILTVVGTFNAAVDDVTPISGSPLLPGALPPATSARVGFFLLVDTAGTPPTGNAPQAPMVIGDMIVCVESPPASTTYLWAHLPLGQAVVAASSVTVTPLGGTPPNPATDVQGALQHLQDAKFDAPLYLTTALAGDGSQANPLDIAIVDGGEYP